MVEPVGHFGRDVVGAATAIHSNDEEVALFLHEVGHFVAEWSESAFVASESFAVECDGSDVVGSTYIYEVALVAVEVNLIERAAVPDVAFVVHQFRLLGVPAARYPQRLCRVETVFHTVALVARHFVAVYLLVSHCLSAERVEHIFPFAIQAGVSTVHGVADEKVALLGVGATACHKS